MIALPGTRVSLADRGSPIRWIHVSGVLREKPPVTLNVLSPVLPFTIEGFVQLLHNPGPRSNSFLEVYVHVIHKDGEHLRPVSELGRIQTTLLRAMQH
jgi:hypothetical protein